MNPESAQGQHQHTPPLILGGASASTPAAPESVRIVANRYLLLQKTGSGLLGDIYEAVDQQLSKAVKYEQRVSVELFSHSYRQLDFESQVADTMVRITRIAHPNLVKVIDFGIDGKKAFLVTELLQGVSLREVMDDTPTENFTDQEVQSVIAGTINALTCIEENGFKHSNLTPGSIFITQNHEVKITDFATIALKQLLGQSIESRSSDTQPLYPNDDVFRISAIAYEMLTNERASASLSRDSTRQPADTLKRNKHIPGYRRKALLRAMQLDNDSGRPSLSAFAREFHLTGAQATHAQERPIKSQDAPRRAQQSSSLKPLAAVLLVIAASTATWMNRNELSDAFQQWSNSDWIQNLSVMSDPGEATLAPDVELAADIETESEVGPDSTSTARAADVNSVTIDNEVDVEANAVDALPTDTMIPQNAGYAESQGSPETVADKEILVTSQNVESLQSESSSQTEPEDSGSVDALYPVRATGRVAESSDTSTPPAQIKRETIVFDQESMIVSESEGMAEISVLRQGNVDNRSSFVWWVVAETANSDLDYADLGVQLETLESGQESAAIYVPIVSDSVAEQRESFFVHLSFGEAADKESRMLEVFIVDDDGAHATALDD